MTAADLTRGLAQIGFVILGLIVLRRMLRNRSTTNVNAAGFFGAILALVLVERSIEVFGDAAAPPEWAARLETALILVLPLALLRLADDFLVLPRRLLLILSAAAVISVTIALVLPEPVPGVAILFLLVYFLGTATYASARFFRASMSARGLTQRRLQAVSAGTGCLMLLVLIAIPAAIFAESPDLWAGLASVAALGSGVAFFAGFAPPRALKDAWQAPEVRQLLTHTTLVRSLANQDTPDFISAMENDLLRALGAREVVVWLWDERSGQLIPPTHPQVDHALSEQALVTEAFRDQQDVIGGSAARDVLGRPGLHLVTPISLDNDRFGMVSAVGSNAAVFAEDDLLLLKALASQLTFALAYRKLLLRLSEAQAREAANELKDDFLSSIAHDLQTPLTTLLGEAQFMDRLAARDPSTPIDRERIRRMIGEAGRMRSMAREMLEANRGEEVSLARDVAPVDLTAIVREVVDDEAPRGRDLRVTTPETAVVDGDRTGLRQLVRNLVENAIKYSPDGGEVQVALELRAESATLVVKDSGIGIAPEDMPHVFERYWRSRRIDDRQFVGTGLGLFLAQRIAQEHGGQISVESALGVGSTFTVTLPLSAVAETTGTICGRDQ